VDADLLADGIMFDEDGKIRGHYGAVGATKSAKVISGALNIKRQRSIASGGNHKNYRN